MRSWKGDFEVTLVRTPRAPVAETSGGKQQTLPSDEAKSGAGGARAAKKVAMQPSSPAPAPPGDLPMSLTEGNGEEGGKEAGVGMELGFWGYGCAAPSR